MSAAIDMVKRPFIVTKFPGFWDRKRDLEFFKLFNDCKEFEIRIRIKRG